MSRYDHDPKPELQAQYSVDKSVDMTFARLRMTARIIEEEIGCREESK